MQPEAFILLNLPNATLEAGNATYDGNLALECVTISVSQAQIVEASARDVYLVLRIKSFETPLDPSGTVKCCIQNSFRRYSFLGGGGEDVVVKLHEPGAHEQHIQEDLDTFDSILAQYTEFQGPQPRVASLSGSEKPKDLWGHVVLVDEDNGEVVGELDNKLVIQEDPTLNDKGRENEPVVIEIPEGQDGVRAAFVRAIPPGEQDMLMRGASLMSYAISGTTNLLLTAITSASSYVINNSQPHPSASASKSPSGSPPPLPPRAIVLLTSERTRKGLSTVHAMSGQAVQVSAKTIQLLDSMIKRAVGGGKGKEKVWNVRNTSKLSPGSVASPSPRSRSPSPAPPAYAEKPPLPPRRGASPQPPYMSPPSGSSSSSSPSPGSPRPLRKRDRLMISADLILSTIDDCAKQIMDVGGQRLNAVVEHKYGADAAHSTSMLTGTAKNVGLVYIDLRGVGRRALIKRVGKEYVKSQVRSRGANL